MARWTARRRKVAKVMRERKRGTLKSGRSGRKVKSRRQAIAIAMAESGQSRNKRSRRKTTHRRKSTSSRRKSPRSRSRPRAKRRS